MSNILTPDMQGFYKDPIPGIPSLDYISYSKISKYMTNPRGFHRQYYKGIKSPDTPARAFGRVVHEGLLEPNKFHDRHIVSPGFSGKGSVAAKREWHDSLDPETVVITQAQADQMMFMIESVQEHPEAVRLLKNSVKETNGYCYIDSLDVWFYYKLDLLLNTQKGLITGDLKTTANASPDSFGRDIATYKYYIQAAIYIDLTERLFGKKIKEFPLIVVETSEPYTTEVYYMPQEWIEVGRQVYLKKIEQMTYDMKMTAKNPNHRWDGYTKGTSIKEIQPPLWAYNKIINSEEFHD